MLASTIQFSKYGQENRFVFTTTLGSFFAGETNHPQKNHHQEFGESRPQPHSYTRSAKIRCSSDPEKPVQESKGSMARFFRTQQRASAFHHTLFTFHARSPEEEFAVLA